MRVYKQFHKAAEESPASAVISAQKVHLEPVTASLPEGAEDAVLTMSPTLATPYVPASDCLLPDEGFPGCSPDPLRFYTPEDFASELLAFQTQVGADSVLGESPVFLTGLTNQLLNSSLLLPENITWDANWQPIVLDQGVVNTSFEDDLLGFLEGVNYQGTVWPITPLQFSEACLSGFSCTSEAASNQSTEDLRARCVNIDGRDTRDAKPEDCRQLNVLNDIGTAVPLNYDNRFRFRFAIVSQLGYADNYSTSAYEQLGIAWNDEGGWEWVGSSWRMVAYDVYYCDGDEEYSWPSNRHHHFFQSQGSDDTSVNVWIDPYGVSYPGAQQWKHSTSFGISWDNNLCRNYYDSSYVAFTNTSRSIARAKILYIDSDWRTNRSQFEGTAVGSWGHVWRDYSFDWTLEIGGQCGTSGCGIGFGFQFKPYNREKSALSAYPRGYSYGY